MAELASAADLNSADPLETLEIFAKRADMDVQRVDETELHVTLSSPWRDVGIWFGWRIEAQVLQIGAPLELRIAESQEAELLKLLALVNERLWFGHFDRGDEETGIIYRNTAILPVGGALDDCQAEIILRGALDAFERFYPAFNFVIWGQMSAEAALEAAISETMGRA